LFKEGPHLDKNCHGDASEFAGSGIWILTKLMMKTFGFIVLSSSCLVLNEFELEVGSVNTTEKSRAPTSCRANWRRMFQSPTAYTRW
jgi:hypothetical protein